MKERDLATVERIKEIVPIEGADRIELAKILDWEVIVGKGEFVPGDLVVYCEYDTLLPVREEFEFLRSRCYSKMYDGFRIKSMKMKGVYSQGIVFSSDILKGCLERFSEGRNVADFLGIRKYDPEEARERKLAGNTTIPKWKKYLMKWKFFRKLFAKKSYDYPANITKSSETNIQKCFSYYKKNPNIRFYKTEKLEGQSATYALYKNKFSTYSHNVKLDPKKENNWSRVADKYHIEEVLRDLKRTHGSELCIQGEIIGPGIQRNVYKLPELQFRVFSIKDFDTGKYLNYKQIETVLFACSHVAVEESWSVLRIVPVVGIDCKMLSSVKEIIGDCEKTMSKINMAVLREGIVWRSMKYPNIGFKAKSPKYDIWFNKKQETE